MFLTKNFKIGIKNPYLKVTADGLCGLRNDNPSNIIIIKNDFLNL